MAAEQLTEQSVKDLERLRALILKELPGDCAEAFGALQELAEIAASTRANLESCLYLLRKLGQCAPPSES